MAAESHRCTFAQRTKSGVELRWTDKKNLSKMEHGLGDVTPASDFTYSADGRLVALTMAASVDVFEVESGELVVRVEEGGVRKVKFSPLGTYLVTFTRWTKTLEEGNVGVWEVASGAAVQRLMRKVFPRGRDDEWSPMWTSDEALYVRGKEKISFFSGPLSADSVADHELTPGGLLEYSVAPGSAPYRIVCRCRPVSKGGPSTIRLYEFPTMTTPLTVKAITRVDSVSYDWAPDGSAVLATVSTEVDASGQSYYGESVLHFLKSDGSFTCAVPLVKEGPIYDSAWAPDSQHFAVVHGQMPSRSILYDTKCKNVFEFSAGPRNHVVFSPLGQFAVLAGFGNLAGDMDFWSMDKLKLMGSAQADCAVFYGWSPDERFFMTASLFPRMRVDNGIQVWSYYGKLIHEEKNDNELSKIDWCPVPDDVFVPRPVSPIVQEALRKSSPIGAAAGAPGAPKKTAYVPPHLRSKSTARPAPPPEGKKKKPDNARLAPGEKPTAQSFLLNVTDDSPRVMLSKKVRNLKKKLRQITSLQDRLDEGSDLSETQLAKLASKDAVSEAIEILQERIAGMPEE